MELHITTNHGYLHLRDVTLEPYLYEGRTWHTAVGTVVDGAETSRLFHASSTKREEPGKVVRYPLDGRKPYQDSAGVWHVSTVFCG